MTTCVGTETEVPAGRSELRFVVTRLIAIAGTLIFATASAAALSIFRSWASPELVTRSICVSVSVLIVAKVSFASAADWAAADAEEALVFAQSSAFAARFRISSRN